MPIKVLRCHKRKVRCVGCGKIGNLFCVHCLELHGFVSWERAIEAAVTSLYKARRLPRDRREQYDGADLRADMIQILKGKS